MNIFKNRMQKSWLKYIFFILISLIVIFSLYIIKSIREMDNKIGFTSKAVLVEPVLILDVLHNYQRALESKDIELFISCFASNFKSSNYANLHELKEDVQKLFKEFKRIKISFESMYMEVYLANVLEGFEGEYSDESLMGFGKFKIVLKKLEVKSEPMAKVTFQVKSKFLSSDATKTQKSYSRTERKRWLLHKKEKDWKVVSEELLPNKY